jgi:hypothetical protein
MVDVDLTFFHHRRDNRVRPWDQHVVGPEAFTELLAQHGASDHKDITMVVPARFKTFDDPAGYTPAPRKILKKDHDDNVVLDAAGEPVVLGVEYPLNPSTGRPYVQRAGGNVLSYSMLAADFDGVLSVEDAVKRFNGFAYWLYTSYNHLTICPDTGRTLEKFRMFFPFEAACPIGEFKDRKRTFLAFLGTDDESCVASSRGFYMPSCPAERIPLARSWFQDGVWLDWEAFEPEVIPEPSAVLKSVSVSVADHPITGQHLDAYVRRAIEAEAEKIRSTSPGNRHGQVVKSARSLGQLVGAGVVDVWDFDGVLFAAACAAGMRGRDSEIRQAIHDGVRYGQAKPRRLPKRKPATRTRRWTGIMDCPWVKSSDLDPWLRQGGDDLSLLSTMTEIWKKRSNSVLTDADMEKLIQQVLNLPRDN